MTAVRPITVDRDLLEILRAEYASAAGHSFRGSGVLGHLTKHDRRMSDDGCLTCVLLDLVDDELHQPVSA